VGGEKHNKINNFRIIGQGKILGLVFRDERQNKEK